MGSIPPIMRSIRLAALACIVVAAAVNSSFSQNATEIPLPEIIGRASEQRTAYQDVFKNLLSRETKTSETYKKNGEVKKQRTIVSTFLVYQLSKDVNRISEFRNVKSVDGKTLNNTEMRAQSLFETVSKAESSDKELQKIEDESQRYDEDIAVTGLTLFQAVPLSDNLRPFFDFKLEGKDSIGGLPVYVVSYQQIKATPYISANPLRLANDHRLSVFYDSGIRSDRDLGERLSGKFWLDAETFQVRREVRDFTLQPPDFPRPVLLAETTFEYQKSDFGILVPKRIIHVQNQILEGDRSSRKEAKIIFDYDNFTKPDVEVKSAEVK